MAKIPNTPDEPTHVTMHDEHFDDKPAVPGKSATAVAAHERKMADYRMGKIMTHPNEDTAHKYSNDLTARGIKNRVNYDRKNKMHSVYLHNPDDLKHIDPAAHSSAFKVPMHKTLLEKYDDLIKQLEEELKKTDMPPPQPAMHAASQVKTANVAPPAAILAQLESANHTQRVHPVVTKGINKGTQAVSSYGLMPIDILETAHKHQPFKDSDTGKQILSAKTMNDINNITKDQAKDDEILNHVWNYKQSRLAANHVATPEQLELLGVMAHRRGITGALKAFHEGGLDSVKADPYVKKYIKIKNTKQVAGL